MTSSDHVFSLLDDDDDDSCDAKEVTSATSVTSCPPPYLPGGDGMYTIGGRQIHRSGTDQVYRRDRSMDGDLGQIMTAMNSNFNSNFNSNSSNNNYNNNNNSTSAASTMSASIKQREVSEYTYAQALLKQAPKLSSSGDLDRSSVLRLAQAYITLQQGLQCWQNSGNHSQWWPDTVDGGRLAVAAQETLGCFMLIMTSQGNVVYVSDTVESLLGHDQLNLVGRSIRTLIHPDELSILAAQFNYMPGSASGQGPSSQRSFYTRMLNARRSGPQHQRFELVHAVGHLQEVMLSTGGGVGGQRETWLMCACRVMSPQVEKEGSNSACTEWISHNALDGKIIYMDARSCQVNGYLSNEMVGLSPYCFVHQDDQEHVAFSHNQALINVGGSSCTYRMYTRSQDLVFVHTSLQLARDKHNNKPKFLFCLHRLVPETEGREQVARHQQELMWVKPDPSIKFSMTDIERTVKALEAEGGNSPMVTSRGGMKSSVLSDSCAADGGDLLTVNVSHLLREPPLSPKWETTKTSVGLQQTRGHNYQYSSNTGQYQQPSQSNMPLASPGGDVCGGNYGYDGNLANPIQQQQQLMYSRQFQQHQHQQQQQQQQHLYSPQHPQYQQQMSLPDSASSACHNLLPGSSAADSPVSATSTGSFVDYLFDNSGPPSVPSDTSALYTAEALMNQSLLTPTGRARGRGRTRGRPRGSGRGGRGLTRGVRGPRGGRGRGSRGRGRGSSMMTMAQFGEVMGSVRKAEATSGSLSPISGHSGLSPRGSMSPMGGPGDHMFMSPNSGMRMQRASSTASSSMSQHLGSDAQQRMSSEGTDSPHPLSGDGMSGLHRMHSEDSMMFQRMTSLDGLDMLDTSSDLGLQRTSSLEMLSPRSWTGSNASPSAQLSPYRAGVTESGLPHKRVGRPRGSRAQHDRQHQFQRSQTLDEISMTSAMRMGSGGGGHQVAMFDQESAFQGHGSASSTFHGLSRMDSNFSGHHHHLSNSSQTTSSGSNNHSNNIRGMEGFQRSVSFQGPSGGHMTPDTDPEHSILGNLLKGRGGSTSSTGSKSPAQTPLNVGRSPGHSMGPERGGRSPAGLPTTLDRGGRSPAHSLISDAASPLSVFSPDSSRMTPSAIKDEPELMSSMEESSSAQSSSHMYRSNPHTNPHQPIDGGSNPLNNPPQPNPHGNPLARQLQAQDHLNSLRDPGEHKSMSEMQVFSTQLRQKHQALKQTLISQDLVLRQLESKMLQAASSSDPNSVYAKLNARLDVIKANKAKQEKELHMIQAKLEAQVMQQQQQQQLREIQQRQQQQQSQQFDLQQRHRLSSPAPASTRRMAIVPPLQRQPSEGDLMGGASPHSSGDLKAGLSGAGRQLSPDSGKSATSSSSALENGGKSGMKTGQQQSVRQNHSQEAIVRTNAGSSTNDVMQNHSPHPRQQPPQASPYSLHHHHHHHHHYHHHPIPTHPTSRLAQPHVDFSKDAPGPPPLPPAYGSYDNPTTASSIMASGAATPGALSISVSSTSTSLASPIVCDTSPVSVDESPSCASDTSSGYHSLSHSADALSATSCVGQYNKAHNLDLTPGSSSLPPYSSKTPPAFGPVYKGAGKSPDLIPISTHINTDSPSI